MIFYGIADAHGIESFKPQQFNSNVEQFSSDPKELSIMALRANANRHRHAVVYQAEVDGDVAKEILELIKDGEYVEALVKLKEEATSISLMRSPGAEKSWNLIPNSDLDPYRD
jgi:hypothetical protein